MAATAQARAATRSPNPSAIPNASATVLAPPIPGTPAHAASAAMSAAPRLLCRSSRPCASFVIFATPPAIVTRRTGWRRRYRSMPPTKSPISSSAISGRPYSAATAASLALPVAPATWSSPAARATSMPRWMESIHAAQEYGTTIPVVPRIDNPPTIPNRPFSVRCASTAPSSTPTSTTRSTGPPATSANASRIICRGTGLIAGSPGGNGSPARVTTPTPGPARNVTPAPPRQTRTRTSAPCVTSGSSPASLTTAATPTPPATRPSARLNAARPPRGIPISTGSGNSPVSNPV